MSAARIIPDLSSSDLARFLSKIEIDLTHSYNGLACWRWTGTTAGPGYGQFSLRCRNVYAYRVSYNLWIGPIPEGLEPDHLCRFRPCICPEHLEAVTHRVNVLRGDAPARLAALSAARGAAVTHCVNGHEYTEANTYSRPSGWRMCRACHRERERKRTIRGRRAP